MRVTAVIIKENNVLLMKRRKGTKNYWLFPGGSVEKGETELEALAREVMEETSLIMKSAVKKSFFRGRREINPIFLCEVEDGDAVLHVDSPEAKLHSETDSYKLEWINLKEALKLKKLYPVEGKKLIRSVAS